MAEQKYIKFITALINATKNDTIEWSYLDSNKLLYQGMRWVKATTIYDNLIGNTSPTPDFNVESSFTLHRTMDTLHCMCMETTLPSFLLSQAHLRV